MTGTQRAAIALGTFFGAGWFPVGPGTFASALAVLLCLALPAPARGLWLLAMAGLLYGPACWAAGVCERAFGQPDPGRVVIDEVVGQMITLAGAPAILAQGGWKYWLAGFIIFRALDIVKPFPIRRLEGLPGGLGIVSDDVMAGAYGFFLLEFVRYLRS